MPEPYGAMSGEVLATTQLAASELDLKLARMRDIFRSLERVAVAFSAGADSTLVLKVALDTLGPQNVVAVTGRSDSLPAAELEAARELAAECGAEHVVLDTEEFSDPNYLANPIDRCYYCKDELYSKLAAFVAERGLKAAVNGVNRDDLKDWRPGIRAAEEHLVRAPCAEAGLTKSEVRQLSARFGLPTFDKPATPCLSSRVQIGEPITPGKLRMIERAEAFLRSLGLRECRVRHHGQLARIELPPDRLEEVMGPPLRTLIDAKLREIGYTWVAVDLRGFRSGSMVEMLTPARRGD